MSLVGPRPCIPYETELFEDHHFERFSVPAGHHGPVAGDGAGALDFRGGTRARRALRAELVVLGRHRCCCSRRPYRSSGRRRPDERAAPRRGRRARLLGPEPPSQPRRARRRRGRDDVRPARRAARALGQAVPGDRTDGVVHRGAVGRPGGGGRDRDARVDPLRARLAGAAVRQAHLRREAARGAARRRRGARSGSRAGPAAS